VIEKFVMDQWALILVAISSGAMLLWPLLKGARDGARLSTLQATQLINQRDALVIDIRDQADYARGHIANAKNFPDKVFGERKAELDKLKDTPVIVSCDTGMRSGASAEKLRALGIKEVFTLQGGLNAWRDAGLPVSK
jgi:rhodanese-related sulfurtransferase